MTDNRLGILLMIATTFVFAAQDGISRHLAGEYNVLMVVTIRYGIRPLRIGDKCQRFFR